MREWPMGHGGFSSPFDDFFSRFFDESRAGRPASAPRRADVNITEYFSDATTEMVRRAVQLARSAGSETITTEHLLESALAESSVQRALQQLGADANAVAAELERTKPRPTGSGDASPQFSAGGKRALLTAFQIARELGASYIGPEHVLLGITLDAESVAGGILARCGVSAAGLETRAMVGATGAGAPWEAQTPAPSKTPTIDQYSVDFTKLAREGKFDPVIGRADEIEQAIEILSRRTKNNPVLIGEPGVGKTAIVEGIAQRIANNDVPETIAGRRLVALDLSGVVAGTQYRGQFEERLKQIIDEIKLHSDELLVFIDELHTVVGAGGAEGSMDAANMLKPALARGELHVIGATTIDEYRKHIEKDAALERRFQPVLIHEPTVDETIAILHGLRDRYEAFHRVRIANEAIVAAAELSDRYVRDRFLPDKAVDLIDQAAARVRLRSKTKPEDRKAQDEELRRLERERDQAIASEEFERATVLRDELRDLRERIGDEPTGIADESTVTADDIATVVSRATGIPLSQLNQAERERLLHLEETLHQRVIGQDEGVSAIAEAVRRARSGLGDPNRPIGSFLFLGPTGVGKTELARALAEALFGDEDGVIRVDMSEFQERHSVSRLVGSPPGYVGYDEAGQLTEAVRRKPYAVVLLDEIEKAHPDVFNILLQLLDDGRLTDGHGRTVDFKNAVIIMTSNLGSERIMALSKSGGTVQEIRDDLLAILAQQMRPEFINRIDEIVVFRALTETQVEQIARLILDRVQHRMSAQRIAVEFSDAAISFVANAGFDSDFGARPLKRAIQRLVENDLARMVLDGRINPRDHVIVDVVGEALDFRVTPQQNPAVSTAEATGEPSAA